MKSTISWWRLGFLWSDPSLSLIYLVAFHLMPKIRWSCSTTGATGVEKLIKICEMNCFSFENCVASSRANQYYLIRGVNNKTQPSRTANTHDFKDKRLRKLPKLKNEYARKSFRFMGEKIYNELPIEIRQNESVNDFSTRLKTHFIRTFSMLCYIFHHCTE